MKDKNWCLYPKWSRTDCLIITLFTATLFCNKFVQERDLEQCRTEGACELTAWGSTLWTGSSFSFIDVLFCNRTQVLFISFLLLIWGRSTTPSTSITVFRALDYYFIQPSQKMDVNKEQFFIGCVKYLKSNKSVWMCWRRVSSPLRTLGQRSRKSEHMKIDLTSKLKERL